MEFDAQTLNTLSNNWDEEIDNCPTMGQMGVSSAPELARIPMIHPDLKEKGLKILGLYQKALQDAPEDTEIKSGLVNHLYLLGYLYYKQITFSLLARGEDSGSADDAEKSCFYLKTAFDNDKDGRCAQLLGEIFERIGFYGSAIHWYQEAEKYTALQNRWPKAADHSRKARLNLQLEDKTSDPNFKHSFPALATPGVQVDPQIAAEAVARKVKAEELRKHEEEQKLQRQQAAEVARKQKEEEDRQRQKVEAEKQQLINAGLCVKCSKPLGFMDKIMGKQTHGRC